MVLEKHPDFLRDFRGDTVHVSTVALPDELGRCTEFRELPQSRLTGRIRPIRIRRVTGSGLADRVTL